MSLLGTMSLLGRCRCSADVAARPMLLGPGAQASRGPKGDPGHATYASRYFHLKVASAIEKVAADQIAMIPI